MTHSSLDEYPIDDEYIDVESQQAPISQAEEDDEDPPQKYDGSHKFDRTDTAMSGTEIDVKFDRKPVSERDKRGGTRTGFNSEDGKDFYYETIIREGKKYTRAKWLMLLQNGYRSPERYVDNTTRDKETYLDIFSAALDITTYQKERTELVLESIDMSEMAHYSRETIILATISIVANEDDRWVREEGAFKQFVEDLGGNMDSIKNTRNLVKSKSKYF